MKRYLALSLAGLLLLVFATGCTRGNRNFQGNQPGGFSASGSSASAVTSAQSTLAATEPPAQPTVTVTPTQAARSTPSGQIGNQLDDALNQLDQQLNSVDTLDDTPAAP
jgi:hypothetical protein